MKKHLPIIIILLFGALLRLIFLGSIPVGVTNDELSFIYNAYSIAKTGKNLLGVPFPFLTWLNAGSAPFLPVEIYLIAPLFFIFPLSAAVGRFPSAALGVADIFILYLLVRKLFRSDKLALLSAFFLAISPWHLHFARSAYETNFSTFFLLLGIYLFIREIERKKLPIFSIFSFMLATYSYRPMNLLLIPFFANLVWFCRETIKISRRQLKFAIISFSLLICSLILVIVLNGHRYIFEASRFYNTNASEGELNVMIQTYRGPVFVRRLFVNKITYSIGRLRENYINAFSPGFLFLNTEPEPIYSIWSRGRVYFIDSIFIILGLAYLFKLNKKSSIFLIILLLASPLPATFSGPPISSRDFFMSLLLPIFSAGGVLFTLSLFRKDLIRKAIISLIIISYTYVFANYLFDYYGRYTNYASENWFKSLKDLTLLIDKNKNNFDRVIVAQSSFQDLIQYAFYNKTDPIILQKSWEQSKKDGNIFKIENVTFMQQCVEGEDNSAPVFKDYKKVLYIVHEGCSVHISPNVTITDYFGNTVWKGYYLLPSSM